MFRAMPLPVAAGAVLMIAATVAGMGLARRWRGHQAMWFAVSGVLLAIVALDLLPDAWAAAGAAGLWWWAVPSALVVSFTVAGLAGRAGCACAADRQHASGAATAVALTVHRFLEGSVLALAGSVAVAVALTAHAFGEGLAVGALLHARRRRQTAAWLAALCAGPVAGVVVARASLVPTVTEPLLPALAAGVLTQAAWVSLREAFRCVRAGRPALSREVTTAAPEPVALPRSAARGRGVDVG